VPAAHVWPVGQRPDVVDPKVYASVYVLPSAAPLGQKKVASQSIALDLATEPARQYLPGSQGVHIDEDPIFSISL
jgi:hypothetical protein